MSAEENALKKIQSVARGHVTRKQTNDEHHWKIFNDIDMQDESEMLELAVFLQNLLDKFTGEKSAASGFSEEIINELDGSRSARGEPADHIDGIDLDNIDIQDIAGISASENIQNYLLPKGSLTMDMCLKIIEVYRKGGMLHAKSVRKIMREHYKMLKEFPNIMKVNIPANGRMNVVGDLHGQLPDLIHILDDAGPPSARNKYIFNGDFVDRGPNGLEITLILMALHVCCPDCVFLNRGNHEDYAICCVYGFQKECKEKYDELTFSMFVEVFRYLPIATVVNESVIVLHGGLFHKDGVTIQDLEQCDRTEYIPKPPGGQIFDTEDMPADEARRVYLDQIMRDSLWSDPVAEEGRAPNPRGAGVIFGPDICREFLLTNSLRMVIRSHECVRPGYEAPYVGSDAEQGLITVFSASNYGGSNNDGAYLQLHLEGSNGQPTHTATPSANGPATLCGLAQQRGARSPPRVYYTAHPFSTSRNELGIEMKNTSSLRELVLKRKPQLQTMLLKASSNGKTVTKAQWAECMQQGTSLQVRWLSLVPILVPAVAMDGENVDVQAFLDNFSASFDIRVGGGATAGTGAGPLTGSSAATRAIFDALYANRAQLEAIFHFFDKDGNGTISREEFRQGCEFLNKSSNSGSGSSGKSGGEGGKLTNYDHILDLMDFDHSEEIDLNEFFEAFRIMDAKDGTVDGVISIAKKS